MTEKSEAFNTSAIIIATEIRRIATEERGDLLIEVGNLLGQSSQYYMASLLIIAGKEYNGPGSFIDD